MRAAAQAFGKTLGEHEGVGFMLADNEMDLHVARLAIWHCAWLLDQGQLGAARIEPGKVICPRRCGAWSTAACRSSAGRASPHETVVARIFADMRAFRIYDGPSEVHRWSIAKRILRGDKRVEMNS